MHCKNAMSQSPQTGQVYFNWDENRPISKEDLELSLNPLKRVKFISMLKSITVIFTFSFSLNPLKRVKFISISLQYVASRHRTISLNPLKRVKFISIVIVFFLPARISCLVSIPSNGSSLFQFIAPRFWKSWSKRIRTVSIPSNGSSLFQYISWPVYEVIVSVSIPSNGSSLFQFNYYQYIISINNSLNPLKRVKFISMKVEMSVKFSLFFSVSIPSNGSSLFQSFKNNLAILFPCIVSIPSNGSSLFQWCF